LRAVATFTVDGRDARRYIEIAMRCYIEIEVRRYIVLRYGFVFV